MATFYRKFIYEIFKFCKRIVKVEILYSTVTLLARFRGLSTSKPFATPV